LGHRIGNDISSQIFPGNYKKINLNNKEEIGAVKRKNLMIVQRHNKEINKIKIIRPE
jgi:hypothetical protein